MFIETCYSTELAWVPYPIKEMRARRVVAGMPSSIPMGASFPVAAAPPPPGEGSSRGGSFIPPGSTPGTQWYHSPTGMPSYSYPTCLLTYVGSQIVARAIDLLACLLLARFPVLYLLRGHLIRHGAMVVLTSVSWECLRCPSLSWWDQTPKQRWYV